MVEYYFSDAIVKLCVTVKQMLQKYCIFFREKYPSFHYIISVDSFELFYYHVFAKIEQSTPYKDGKLDVVDKESHKDGDKKCHCRVFPFKKIPNLLPNIHDTVYSLRKVYDN